MVRRATGGDVLQEVLPRAQAAARGAGLDPRVAAHLLGRKGAPVVAGSGSDTPWNVAEVVRDYQLALEQQRSARKGSGSFYSPPELSRRVAARTLDPLLEADAVRALPRVCDPSVGAGGFLMAALEEIHRRTGAARSEIVRECLFGVDLDDGALAIARTSLWLAAEDPDLDPAVLERNLRCGDAVFGRWPGGENIPPGDGDGIDWHADFAQVFADGGFDAVLGNPPWDIKKPDSRSFFERVDPGFRDYDKQTAVRRQKQLIRSDPELGRAWNRHQSLQAERSTWLRAGNEPFTHLGRGDANAYKIFLDLGMALLRTGGRLGMIVPSGLYSDYGAAPLRKFLLEENRWEWLFGFENRRRMFPIDNRCKFAAIVVERGGRGRGPRCAFLRTAAEDWDDPRAGVRIDRETLDRFSPVSRSFPEVEDLRDWELLTSLHTRGTHLGNREWAVRYRRELDMTLSARHFMLRDEAEEKGWRRQADGTWERKGERAFPLVEGRMLDAYRDDAKAWISGHGRRALWEAQGADQRGTRPQFLVGEERLHDAGINVETPKLGFMAIGSATNARSMIAAMIPGNPCGNSVPVFYGPQPVLLSLCAVLNSFVFDYALRARLAGTNINRFVLEECPLPRPGRLIRDHHLHDLVRSLVADGSARFAGIRRGVTPVVDPEERRRVRAQIEARVARAWTLGPDELRWILRDCTRSSEELRDPDGLHPKGFWRIDRDLPPSERLPALTLEAFGVLPNRY